MAMWDATIPQDPVSWTLEAIEEAFEKVSAGTSAEIRNPIFGSLVVRGMFERNGTTTRGWHVTRLEVQVPIAHAKKILRALMAAYPNREITGRSDKRKHIFWIKL